VPKALSQAREALGGPALGAVRALRIRGRSVRDGGPLRLSADIDMQMAFPDRYTRTDRLVLGGLSTTMTAGFNGSRAVQRASGPNGMQIDPAAQIPQESRGAILAASATAARQDLARLLLGLFASPVVLPLEFHADGVAESPDGMADVIGIRGDDGFVARLFLDAGTHLPLMVTWLAPDPAGLVRTLLDAGAGTAPDAKDPVPDVLTTPPAAVEHRIYFAEYRNVRGYRWPFGIRRSIAGAIVEEIAVDAFTVNPTFAPDAFEPAR
jgi:hypothetical protein